MKVYVNKAFHLTRDNGDLVKYSPGEQDMPDADANHWWTAIHADVKKGGKKGGSKATSGTETGGESSGEGSEEA